MDNSILLSIAGMGGLGLFFALVLAYADKKFSIAEDARVEEILSVLPGVNCGACGCIGCRDYAGKTAKGEVEINLCKPGGPDVVEKIAGILGREKIEIIEKKAVVHCAADGTVRTQKAVYSGAASCAGANTVKGGAITCEYGCLGFGDCFTACPFGAIDMVNGLPRISFEKCVACGKCVAACPRDIITLEKTDNKNTIVYVACSSLDKAADTRKICRVGCIACGICERLSDKAFKVRDNLSRPDYALLAVCEKTDEAIAKCPTKVIKKFKSKGE